MLGGQSAMKKKKTGKGIQNVEGWNFKISLMTQYCIIYTKEIDVAFAQIVPTENECDEIRCLLASFLNHHLLK